MKPVCVPCQRFYRPHKNGYYFIEGRPVGKNVPPGTVTPSSWVPYKLWSGDLWRCEGCGAQIVVGAGFRPVAEEYQPDFKQQLESYAPAMQVNDC